MYFQDIDRCNASIERAHKNGIIILGSYGEHDSSLFINFTMVSRRLPLLEILIRKPSETFVPYLGRKIHGVDHSGLKTLVVRSPAWITRRTNILLRVAVMTEVSPFISPVHTGVGVGTSPAEHTGKVNTIVFSPDKQYILSGSEDGAIYNYTFTGKNKLFKFELSQSSNPGVNSICSYPNGRYALSGSLAAKMVLFAFVIHRRGKWGRRLYWAILE